MLILDLKIIGNKLYELRTQKLLSRADVAERAELSERTYADIERGSVNMRLDTLLKICGALNITPDQILTREAQEPLSEAYLLEAINRCTEREQQTVFKLLKVYIDSLYH